MNSDGLINMMALTFLNLTYYFTMFIKSQFISVYLR